MRTPNAGLRAAVVAAILFVGVAGVEGSIRPAFDWDRHAISMLSLGERGWVMVATFLVTGALVMWVAASLRAVDARRRWVSRLVTAFSIGLILAGFFPAPRGQGFPAGTPSNLEPEMTTTAILHSVAFQLAFTSLIVAAVLMTVAYARERRPRWALFSGFSAVLIPVLIALGATRTIPTGIGFYLASCVAWAWLAAVAVQHLVVAADARPRQSPRSHALP
ncbi:DUF998 domain-containing protein [Kribbella sp. NPDC048915]|uniref:DUF998 domain-containing protein n=1 Tax=Kribbella sp. NPDC048915 TaxID=3155148 RepID=UPI0033E3EBA3